MSPLTTSDKSGPVESVELMAAHAEEVVALLDNGDLEEARSAASSTAGKLRGFVPILRDFLKKA